MLITIRSADPRRARALQGLLAEVGVAAAAAVGPERAEHGGEDCALIDLCGDMRAAGLATAAELTARPHPPLSVVALIGGAPLSNAEAAAFDSFVDLDAPLALASARIEAATRAGIARWEASLRAQTAREHGLSPQVRFLQEPPRVLAVGQPCPFFLALERALLDRGARVEATFSPAAAFERLHDAAIDALALNAGGDAGLALSLCGALRRNSDLHDVPTLVIAPPNAPDLAAAAIRRGASQIARPDAPADAVAGALLQDIAWRRRARRDLAALSLGLGGALTASLFGAHLNRQALAHQLAQRPFAIAAMRLAPPPGAAPLAGVRWRRAFGEAAHLISRTVRTCDLCFAAEPSLILIAMPATDEIGAQAAAARAGAVGACTTFLNDAGEAGLLLFDSAAVELAPGETGSALMARAISRLAPAAALA